MNKSYKNDMSLAQKGKFATLLNQSRTDSSFLNRTPNSKHKDSSSTMNGLTLDRDKQNLVDSDHENTQKPTNAVSTQIDKKRQILQKKKIIWSPNQKWNMILIATNLLQIKSSIYVVIPYNI